MGLFGKSRLQEPPAAGGSSSPGHSAAAVPEGLLGASYSQYGTLEQAWAGPQCLETIRAQALELDVNDLGKSAVPSTVGCLGGEGF